VIGECSLSLRAPLSSLAGHAAADAGLMEPSRRADGGYFGRKAGRGFFRYPAK
jgi:hypothetical protein